MNRMLKLPSAHLALMEPDAYSSQVHDGLGLEPHQATVTCRTMSRSVSPRQEYLKEPGPPSGPWDL